MPAIRIALKVDCDTAEGTRRGIPRLLALFDELQIRATFFFSLGPDRSGRAVIRLFTKKGFLRKMLRSRAPSLYGWRTMLSGTLLPSPVISAACRREILSVAEAGHETGVHAWDHVGWQDRLDAWSEGRIASEYARLHEAYRSIFGKPAAASAAPGWTVNDRYLGIREGYPLAYTSDTREGRPFLPLFGGRTSAIPEIPSTLPTLDERLGDPRLPTLEALRAHYAVLPSEGADAIHSIHTEVEGGPYLSWFRGVLQDWKARGARFVALEEIARGLGRSGTLPARPIARITLPGRSGTVASAIARG
jgi:undecaprenyl phosphate-alpha-L-ara4FN deformylase